MRSCVLGLRAVAEAMSRLAAGDADRGDLNRIHRWSDQIVGRGAATAPTARSTTCAPLSIPSQPMSSAT